MLNPARADDTRDDPTIRRVIHFSRSWGFGSATVVNLYPFRSTIPAECRAWTLADAGVARRCIQENDRAVTAMALEGAAIVAAWGTVGWARERAAELGKQLARDGIQPMQCLGMTADGSPLHPMARGRMRVPDDRLPIRWPESL